MISSCPRVNADHISCKHRKLDTACNDGPLLCPQPRHGLVPGLQPSRCGNLRRRRLTSLVLEPVICEPLINEIIGLAESRWPDDGAAFAVEVPLLRGRDVFDFTHRSGSGCWCFGTLQRRSLSFRCI